MKMYNAAGQLVDLKEKVTGHVYSEASAQNLSVRAYLNREFGATTDVQKYGQPFDQLLASVGLVVPNETARAHLGLRAPSMADILDGRAGMNAASTTSQSGTPYGNQSRTLFPAAVIAYMETALVKDYDTDATIFDEMIAQNLAIAGELFEQPQINYSTGATSPNNPMTARASHRGQLALPAVMMTFTTSDKARRIPSYAIGMEFSNEALKATTLDLVGLTLRRQLAVEKDAWVYSYISDMLNGDNDINSSSLSSLGYSVLANSLDSAIVANGVLTQKAWLKWLARRRKYRRIDYIMCDLNTYLAIEGRSGRPSLTAIDTIIPRVESQARVIQSLVGDVKVFIVDDASAGGPIPANTILGLDSRYAMVRVTNTSAEVQAAETYALRQGSGFMVQHGEIVYRLHDDAFDVLVLTTS